MCGVDSEGAPQDHEGTCGSGAPLEVGATRSWLAEWVHPNDRRSCWVRINAGSVVAVGSRSPRAHDLTGPRAAELPRRPEALTGIHCLGAGMALG